MDKICVFCGAKPKSKNKEHIIPKWLMEHIGIENDVIRFGFDKHTGVPREFICKAFTFPACEKCNLFFSELENIAKPIILKILSEKPLEDIELHHLLDWFDKVRIGLWLAFYYLDKNIGKIKPKFQIQTRIGIHDRLLHIVKISDNPKELSFRGCDTVSFHFTPSCFSMIINNFCFYNISAPFVCSRRIGFPFPSKSYMREDGLADYYIKPARCGTMLPIFRKQFAFKGIGIYQPIYRLCLNANFSHYYDVDYVKSNSLCFESGIGKIFLQNEQDISLYASEPSLAWEPSIEYSRKSMNPYISIDTLKKQLYIQKQSPSIERLSESSQRSWKAEFKSAEDYSNRLIKKLEENSRKLRGHN